MPCAQQRTSTGPKRGIAGVRRRGQRPASTPRLGREALKDLERNPGSTPALEQVSVKPGPAHKSLEGKPGAAPGFGPEDAPVRVFVFSDFQCPVCRRVVEPIKKLARDYGDKVQIVMLQNALKMHRQAEIAAAASLAAFRQGKFWDFHDKVFINQRLLGRDDLIGIAKTLGLDVKRFTADLDDPALRAQIAYERDLAAKLGATGTPGFFVNGQLLRGWGSYAGFKGMVDRALRAAKKLPATTSKGEIAIKATIAHGDKGKQFAELYWGREK